MSKLAEDSGSRRSMFMVRQFISGAILRLEAGSVWWDGRILCSMLCYCLPASSGDMLGADVTKWMRTCRRSRVELPLTNLDIDSKISTLRHLSLALM